MGISRSGFAGVVLVASFTWQAASAAPILMPAGSTVWMKFESNQAPFENGGDAAGSNLPGQAPPNGIPSTTVTSGSISTTGYAEILSERIHNFTTGFSQFMHSSFQDSYTVGGTAAGPFDVTVQLHATGVMTPFEVGGFHQLQAGNAQAKIGTFLHDPTWETESQRVVAFNPAAEATTGAQFLFAPGSIPIDITASYTKTSVNVGDVFDLAYQLRSAAGRGEIDVIGAISFTLPDGVFLTSTMAQGLPAPGSIKIVGNDGINDGITVVNIADLGDTSGDLEVSQNSLVEVINIAAGAVGGDLILTENDNAAINVSAGAVGGNLVVTENDDGTIDVSAESVGGEVAVTDNTNTGAVDVSTGEASSVSITGNEGGPNAGVSIGTGSASGVSITGNEGFNTVSVSTGSASGVSITGNEGVETINVSSGGEAGSVTITDNGGATVNLNDFVGTTGSVTIDSTGGGTFAIGGDGEIAGSVELDLDGYAGVEGPVGDSGTAVTMVKDEARMELVLPAGAFPLGEPVRFSIDHLPGGAVETVNGDTVTHLESYQFNFDIPTLGQAAELNFEINLLAMDDADRLSLLDLLDADALLTLAVRGDDPGAALQLFDVCAPGMDPILDECVRVLWLDANGLGLDPLAGIDPSLIRFEGLVGHFSTYSVVAVVVPEPASLALLSISAMGLLRHRRRQFDKPLFPGHSTHPLAESNFLSVWHAKTYQ